MTPKYNLAIIGLVFFMPMFILSCGESSSPYTAVTTINEDQPQTGAVIKLSDPQVYARETLINDRRQELRYLLNELKKSETIFFEPQLTRDLRTFQTINAELALLSKGANQPPSSNAELGKSGAQPTDTKTASEKEEKRETDSASASPQSLSYPQELFRDRQAYRAEIRSAIAEVNLDDVHDYAGNALYRLQFRATVMPGKHKNKYGVAQLTVLPPELKGEEIERIYKAWLGHSTGALNFMEVNARNQTRALLYEALGIGSGMYEIAKFPVPIEPDDEKSCSNLEKARQNLQEKCFHP